MRYIQHHNSLLKLHVHTMYIKYFDSCIFNKMDKVSNPGTCMMQLLCLEKRELKISGHLILKDVKV